MSSLRGVFIPILGPILQSAHSWPQGWGSASPHCQPPPVNPTEAWAAPQPLPAFLHHPPLLFNGSPMPFPPKNRVRSSLGGEPTVLAQLRHRVPGAARGTAQGCCDTAHRIFRHGHRSAASPLLPKQSTNLQTPTNLPSTAWLYFLLPTCQTTH